MITRTAILALLVSLSACGGDATKSETKTATKTTTVTKTESATATATEKDKAKDVAKPEAPVVVADAGPFAAWDMPGREKAFAGAHLAPGDMLGTWVAWDVQDKKVKVWDGTAEKNYDLRVKSPCEVEVIENSAGGSSSTTSHYTIDKDGNLVMGLGDAGTRKGPEAVACISDKVVTLDAKGACTVWEESMFDKGKYESKPGTCAWVKDGDKEMFSATVNGAETRLLVDGDALMTEQMQKTHSLKQADYAAARTARDAKAGSKVAGH